MTRRLFRWGIGTLAAVLPAQALIAVALADPYAVLDRNGVIQNVIEADDKTPCAAAPGCTLRLLSQVPLADRGVYGGPRVAAPVTDQVCDPASVKFDGASNLVLCAPDGKSVTTAPVPAKSQPANPLSLGGAAMGPAN
jgi:hypothetical protein